MALLQVSGLSIRFADAGEPTVRDVAFSVESGETLAIVGESGSGKTLTALALAGLLPPSATIAGGSALFEGRDLFTLDEDERRIIRGRRIGMIFQEPMTSLNPVLTIGRQMTEGQVAHGLAGPREAEAVARDWLGRVGLPEPARLMDHYPHQLSGGMRQRAMIAMAMAMQPSLLIADEPTTALDVTVQAQILALLRSLAREVGAGLILITHDMGVVAEMADRVIVMRRGRIVEEAQVAPLFAAPREAYTRALLNAAPRLDGPAPAARPVVGSLALRVAGVTKTFGRGARALDDVSLDIKAGETLALVGESGSGKSTLGRAILRLVGIDSGAIELSGQDISRLSGRALQAARRRVQMIFQDPYASLDPRMTVGAAVAEPLLIHRLARGRAARARAAELIAQAGLHPAFADRFPHELSGGQRQRVAIARALACGPSVLVADEPTSALDVSVQSQVLDLLARLREAHSLAMLFISHDLAVVRRVADRIAVMRQGRIVESGPARAVLEHACHPYTRALLDAAPRPDPASRARPRLAPPSLETGHRPMREVGAGHWAAT